MRVSSLSATQGTSVAIQLRVRDGPGGRRPAVRSMMMICPVDDTASSGRYRMSHPASSHRNASISGRSRGVSCGEFPQWTGITEAGLLDLSVASPTRLELFGLADVQHGYLLEQLDIPDCQSVDHLVMLG